MRRLLPWLWLPLLLCLLSDAAAHGRDRRMNLWGGQASILRPEGVQVVRFKENENRYELKAAGTKVKVVVERGLIPSKYRGVGTEKIAREARARLQRRGHKVERFSVAGKTARITFSGTRKTTVPMESGPLRVEVPWRAQLRWVRQTNHRTYQTLVSIPQPEREKDAVMRLRRAAASLRVPSMRAKPWERVNDSLSNLTLLGERVGPWMPAWKMW